MLFEVCIDSVEGALAAHEMGAQRVELCDNLVEGGTTPSLGMMRIVRRSVPIAIHAIIRPRGGDFLYSDAEFAVMQEDIQAAKQANLNGVVIGILLPDGRVDVERTRTLVELARPLSVTFHRAFDLSRDPYESLEALVSAGVDRVLTGGHASRAMEGLECLTNLVHQAGERIAIMACGGINSGNVATVIGATGVQEVHFAARMQQESPMTYRRSGILMGSSYTPNEYVRKTVDKQKIAAVIRSVRP